MVPILVKKFPLVTFFDLENPFKYQGLDNGNREYKIGIEFNHRDHGRYLFNGYIELYKVDCRLIVVIRKCTGELIGYLNYEYISINNGTKCIDLKSDKVIKTIYHLNNESYLIKIRSKHDFKVLKMELCPGDEIEFSNIIKEFEQGVI